MDGSVSGRGGWEPPAHKEAANTTVDQLAIPADVRPIIALRVRLIVSFHKRTDGSARWRSLLTLFTKKPLRVSIQIVLSFSTSTRMTVGFYIWPTDEPYRKLTGRSRENDGRRRSNKGGRFLWDCSGSSTTTSR